MPELSKGERTAIYFLLSLLLLGTLVMLWEHRGDFFSLVGEQRRGEKPEEKTPAAVVPVEKTPVEEPVLVVHVAGAVRTPGVYKVKKGARVVDAVAAAGGPAEGAQVDALNLAATVQDGQKIYVPTAGQTGGNSGGNTVGAGGKMGGNGKVNLNTASEAELERIPGIGPAMAQRILLYREKNGLFRRVEDLLKVSGIGEKKLEELRNWVTVE